MVRSFTQIPIIGTFSTTSMMLPSQKLAISPQKMSGCSRISCGPGTMPWMMSAPSRSAITESPGMPRLIVGMKSPCTDECVDDSGQATPSIAPRPQIAQLHIRVLQIDLDRLVHALEEFGDPKEAERERDDLNTVVKLGDAEGK